MRTLSLIFVALAAHLFIPASSNHISSRCQSCHGVVCGIDASCNPKTRKCECPWDKPAGDPKFRCYAGDSVTCDLVADPVVTGFSGDNIPLDFFCNYALASFETQITTGFNVNGRGRASYKADRNKNRCEIKVYGSNAISDGGSYYLNALSIAIGIKVDNNIILSLQINLIDTESSITLTISNGYGGGQSKVVKNDNIGCGPRNISTTDIGYTLCYNVDIAVWELVVPLCGGTIINMRNWQIGRENQLQKPGASISTNEKVVIFKPDASFPGTFCDSIFNDIPGIYKVICDKLGFVGKRLCALYAFLSNSPRNQTSTCASSIKAFNSIPQSNRVRAVQICGLIQTKFARCVLANGNDVLSVFNECLVDINSGGSIGDLAANKIRRDIPGCNSDVDEAFGHINTDKIHQHV